jgi:hypothetical protein
MADEDSHSALLPAKSGFAMARAIIAAHLSRLVSKERLKASSIESEASGLWPHRSGSKDTLHLEGSPEPSGMKFFVRIGSKNTLKDLVDGLDGEELSLMDDDEHHVDGSRDITEETARSTLKSTFSFGRFRKEKELSSESIAEITNLEEIIKSKLDRHRLVDALLVLADDLSVKVRFVSAVDEFLHAEGSERRTKGAQIVRMFVTQSSMFHLRNIPSP